MPKSFLTIFIESCIVGLLLIPFAYLAGFLAKQISRKPTLPEICNTWNKYYVMEINLFLTGFLFHLVAEYSGLNQYYVNHYYS